VPLLLVDLDDTLIDRRGSFRNWATDFCARRGLGDEVAWLVEVDRYGYTPREELLARACERFSLAEAVDELVGEYRREYPTYALPPSPEALALLRGLRANGWRIGVVTNGHQTQSRKLEAAGVAELIDTCCVSEIEGVRKPDAAIFERAAECCGLPLAGGWMAGDNPEADIRGAHALGLQTIWFRHDREWEAADFAPTLVVDSLEEALAHLAGLR
jgi:putative hydrolase of the HAD superfamily